MLHNYAEWEEESALLLPRFDEARRSSFTLRGLSLSSHPFPPGCVCCTFT